MTSLLRRSGTPPGTGQGSQLHASGWPVQQLEQEQWRKGQRLPVGVFEADAGLLELISILQFGHILDGDTRLSHGFLQDRTWL